MYNIFFICSFQHNFEFIYTSSIYININDIIIKEDAEQNEDSNQHASLHHSIHLGSHASNSAPHIQHSDQTSLGAWSRSLAHGPGCERVRNNTLKLQEWAGQETSQDAKQMSISCSWCIQDHADSCSRNRDTHFPTWSVSEH